MVRLLIGELYPLFLEGIHEALRQEPDFEVIGEVADGSSLLARAVTLNPDVVLCDVDLPDLGGPFRHRNKAERQTDQLTVAPFQHQRCP